jgi:ferric-dicitrate binding protein FerR (iron transport regulator)
MKNEKTHIDEKIIIQYLENEIDTNDRLVIENWLKENEDNANYFNQVKRIYISSENINDFEKINTKEDFRKISRQLKLKNDNKFQFVKIAASIILLVCIAFIGKIIYQNNQPTIYANNNSEVMQITLPDGSVVWLNSESYMKHKGNFNKNLREIEFEGEAFFEIEKNPEKAFFINTKSTQTKVLGTSFNLKTTNRETEIAVVTGKVMFNSNSDKLTLVAGDRGFFNENSKKLVKKKYENKNFLAWKTKSFVFEDETLLNVFQDLENAYHVEIVINNKLLEEHRISGEFTNQEINDILNEIGIITGLNIKKTDNKYYIDDINK